MNINPYHIPYTKNLRLFIALITNAKIVQLEESTEKCLYNLDLGKSFLHETEKNTNYKRKKLKFELHQNNKFLLFKKIPLRKQT